jgi:hypothetical protein
MGLDFRFSIATYSVLHPEMVKADVGQCLVHRSGRDSTLNDIKVFIQDLYHTFQTSYIATLNDIQVFIQDLYHTFQTSYIATLGVTVFVF